MNEIWRPVVGLEHTFEVSNLANVRNKNTGTIMSPQTAGSKYVFYMLYDSTKKKRVKKYLHRLVALQFIPNPYKYHEVNHLDGNKYHNLPENLEWCNPSLNQLHAIATGLRTKYFREGDTAGELNANSKLTWQAVLDLRNWWNQEKRTIADIKVIAPDYFVSFQTLYDVIKGNKWKAEQMPEEYTAQLIEPQYEVEVKKPRKPRKGRSGHKLNK